MKTISNERYKVTMADEKSGCQWVKIESVKTGKELIFVYTTGTIKVGGIEISPKVCEECGRGLP